MCFLLDIHEQRLDVFKAAHENETFSEDAFVQEMALTSKLLAHVSHGHEGSRSCQDDRAQAYFCGR